MGNIKTFNDSKGQFLQNGYMDYINYPFKTRIIQTTYTLFLLMIFTRCTNTCRLINANPSRLCEL